MDVLSDGCSIPSLTPIVPSLTSIIPSLSLSEVSLSDWLSMLQSVQSALCFLEPFNNVRQSSRVRSQQVHISKQLNKAESGEDMKTSDKQVRLKRDNRKITDWMSN